jgi:hypothetical protein
MVALVVTIALTAGGQQWFTGHAHPGAGDSAAPTSVAQEFAEAALAAFSPSMTVPAPAAELTAAQRSSGLPADPVTGLTSVTPAGPVQIVLPAGLGAAQHTTGGQVVYPDSGAGFDFLAENTGTGTRTVARIAGPDGVRMVTTFVRTPADTVMLAHTNGYLTINRATPTAETVGMFAPAETRDAAGKLVPSSYVVKKVAPQLYLLAEVFDPRPDTAWPAYVDPPLHIGGPVPAGLFDSITFDCQQRRERGRKHGIDGRLGDRGRRTDGGPDRQSPPLGIGNARRRGRDGADWCGWAGWSGDDRLGRGQYRLCGRGFRRRPQPRQPGPLCRVGTCWAWPPWSPHKGQPRPRSKRSPRRPPKNWPPTPTI